MTKKEDYLAPIGANYSKIVFSVEAWHKMRTWVDNCKQEVSGIGKIEIVDGNVRVVDVALFKQTVTSASSTLDDDAMAMFTFEMVKRGENLKDWSLWWHSHARMDVFWSGTDNDTIEKNANGSMLVSVVSNHKGETLGRIDTFTPLRTKFDCAVEFEIETSEVDTALLEELHEKVSQTTYAHTGTGFKTSVLPYRDDAFGDHDSIVNDFVSPYEVWCAAKRKVAQAKTRDDKLDVLYACESELVSNGASKTLLDEAYALILKTENAK